MRGLDESGNRPHLMGAMRVRHDVRLFAKAAGNSSIAQTI